MKGTPGQLARAVKKLRVSWDERVRDPRDKRGQRHGHHGLLNLLVAGFAGAQTVAFDGKWVWTSTRHVIEGARGSLGEHAATSALLAEKAVLVSSAARPILDFEMAGAKSGEAPAFRRMFGRVAAAFGKSFDIVTADAGLTAKANAALRRAAQAKTSAPAWKRVALLVRDVLVAPHAEARAVFEA